MMYKRKKSGFMNMIFAGAMAATFVAAGVSALAEEIKSQRVSDGFVTIEGELNRESGDAPVTLLVTSSDIDFTNETAWLTMNGDEIAYYKETTLQDDKTYKFNFKLTEPGIYNVYLASKNSGIEKSQIVYIDGEMNSALMEAITEITDAETLEFVLAEHLKDFGVFAFESSDVDEEVAEILIKSLENKEDVKTDEITLLIEKAILASKINKAKLDSFYDYPQMSLLDDEIFEYCTEEIAEDVAKNMRKNKISDDKEFDEALLKSTVVEIANTKDGVLALKEVLKAYKDELDIDKTITTDMCESLIKESDFSDFEELYEKIDKYKKPTTSGGGGGSGSSGGGSNKPSVNLGNIANVIPTTVNNSQITEKPEEILPFDDLENVLWAKDAITRLYKDKVINGKSEKLFYPMDNVTRAEFAKILMLAFDVNLVDDECPFVDVLPDEWSYQYVKTAYLAGVVNGIDEVTFGKNMNITREDLCTMVYRLILTGKPELSSLTEQSSFKDSSNISEYAEGAVGFMQKNAVINGDDKGNFNPKSPATRAEAVKIVYNAMNLYEKN